MPYALLPVTCPCGEKTPPPCRGGGSKSRRGFPPTYRSAKEIKRPLWPPQRKQNGHYGRRKGNKTAIMAAARETKGHYGRRTANRRGVTPRGCEPPPPLRARPPARRDSSFRPALTADIQDSVLLNSFNSFFQMVLPPPRMRAVPSLSRAWRHESFSRRKNQLLPRGAVLAALKYGIHPRQGRFPCRCPVFPAVAFDPLFPSDKREMPRLGHFLWTFRA